VDTVGGISKYWTGAKWLPGKGPPDDYCLYRVHEVGRSNDKGYSITSDPSQSYKKVWFTKIGTIHNYYGNETFTPEKDPWLDHGPVQWFVNHYYPYGQDDQQQEIIALAELAQV